MATPQEYDVGSLLQTAPSATEGYDVNQLLSGKVVPVEPQETISWKDVPLMAARNIPGSAWEAVKGVGQAIAHPIDTAQALYQTGKGAAQYIGERAMQLSQPEFKMEHDPQAREAATQFAKHYATRYGTEEGFKEALAKDPFGVAMDLASVVTPFKPEAVTGAVKAAAKLPGTVAKTVLGETTGVGREAIEQAYQAGKVGNKTFWENLTGKANMTDALDSARAGLDNIRQAKNKEYRSGMMDISKDKSVLNFDAIDKKLSEANEFGKYKGQVLNESTTNYLSKVNDAINEWKSLNPAEYHTPEGFDALKKQIGGILEGIPYNEKQARTAVGNVYSGLKSTINEQAPTYSKVMGNYADATDSIREIEQSLSIGDKARVDTAMRKLQSLMRNNVNTNYGYRGKLAQRLQEEGGVEFMPALAGQALSSPTPRGLAKVGPFATAIEAIHNPSIIGLLPFQSPRAVGAGAYAAGRVAGAGNTLADILKAYIPSGRIGAAAAGGAVPISNVLHGTQRRPEGE